MLWEELSNTHDFRFLLTNRLNQDCIENLFSIIRAKCGLRDNPDCGQFRAAFRQVMVDMVMIPSKLANCENDVDKFLCSLSNIKEALNPIDIGQASTSFLDTLAYNVKSILSVCTIPTENDQGLSLQESNILNYIGGYIVKKLKDRICNVCFDKVVGKLESDNCNHAFTAEKSLGSLQYPSTLLLGVVQHLEIKYREIIDSCIHSLCIKAQISETLGKLEILDRMKCVDCHTDKLIVNIMINIRLHHMIKEVNRNLRDSKDRKNRKTIKFSHL